MPDPGSLDDLGIGTNYRTDDLDPLTRFLKPAMAVSIGYERAVGYFRTSILPLVGVELVEMAIRGGKVRIVCSPSLESQDVDDWKVSSALAQEAISRSIRSDFEAWQSKRPEQSERVRVLATLLFHGSLDVKVAFRPGAHGIYHEKLGIFHDHSGNSLSFIGSSNETAAAWGRDGNYEGIEVFRSWGTGDERQRVMRHLGYFDSLWEGRVHSLRVIDLDDATVDLIRRYAYPTLHEALSAIRRSTLTSPFSKADFVARPHQVDAVANWIEQGHRGIFEHATGSGKTISALMAMRPHLENGNPVLVIVPSSLLADQWVSESRKYYENAAVLDVMSIRSTDDRTRRLKAMLGTQNRGGDFRISIVTMQSASKDWFLRAVPRGAELMIVADEVHRVGSQEYRRVLSIDAPRRLGLSATPKRYGDPEGTAAIFDYFGDIITPRFGISDAIASGALVPYRYFVEFAELSESEQHTYTTLTKRLSVLLARAHTEGATRGSDLENRAKHLLIQRARVAKSASEKTGLACEILKGKFSEGQRWVVYCEDRIQLSSVHERLRALGLPTFTYHSAQDLKGESLGMWIAGGGVLVAIRCLDEGVDIPSISHALILASSRNPREFVQRRGRVLRKAPGKLSATIIDVLVMPEPSTDASFDSLAAAEAGRALLFAQYATNIDVVHTLRTRLANRNPRALEQIGELGDEHER